MMKLETHASDLIMIMVPSSIVGHASGLRLSCLDRQDNLGVGLALDHLYHLSHPVVTVVKREHRTVLQGMLEPAHRGHR